MFFCHLSHVKVTQPEKSTILFQFERFRMSTPIWIDRWLWNGTQSFWEHGRAVLMFSRSFVKFEGHMGQKNDDLDPIERLQMIDFQGHPFNFKVTLAIYKVTRPAAAIKSPRFALFSIQSYFYINTVRYCHVRYSTSFLPCECVMNIIIICLFVGCLVWWKGNAGVQWEMFVCDEMHNESIINTLSVWATPRANLRNALWWTIVILSIAYMIPQCFSLKN